MKKLLILLLLPFLAYTQSPCDSELCVVQFNAGWNSANDVEWVGKLKNCEIHYIDIAADAASQAEY